MKRIFLATLLISIVNGVDALRLIVRMDDMSLTHFNTRFQNVLQVYDLNIASFKKPSQHFGPSAVGGGSSCTI